MSDVAAGDGWIPTVVLPAFAFLLFFPFGFSFCFSLLFAIMSSPASPCRRSAAIARVLVTLLPHLSTCLLPHPLDKWFLYFLENGFEQVRLEREKSRGLPSDRRADRCALPMGPAVDHGWCMNV